ncbi:MAG: hypothetical protein E7357_05340 [Clostridiales bacterium]|nr:hypothetical protein [Clostridiales bacterium]
MGKKKKALDSKAPEISKIAINKIIYFDKETIRNILQQYYKGSKQTVTNEKDSGSIKLESNIEAEASIKIPLPFFSRLKFLFSSKIASEYIAQFDKTVTVTSTEISDFEKVKEGFTEFTNIIVSDIENSATFFRVAGNYTRILKSGVKDVDTKEFKNVMEGYEGYDHYKIDDETYIRFNSTAFLSNYKRNDLLNSKLTAYCIFIGSFPKSSFDFIDQLNKMQNLTTVTPNQTIGDIYPHILNADVSEETTSGQDTKTAPETHIKLFDVVYASISQKDE